MQNISTSQNTEDFYSSNADRYFSLTIDMNNSRNRKKFLNAVACKGRILDAGSGSGRDTLAFLKAGYQVDAFDASPAMAKLSSQHTGIETNVMQFSEVSVKSAYDGVWACASLLHIPEKLLSSAVSKLTDSLKSNGVFFGSFKYGNSQRRSSDGRHFTDMNVRRLKRIIETSRFSVDDCEIWRSEAKDPFGETTQWINFILRKLPTA